MHMCIHVNITLQRECDLFNLQLNVHRIRTLHLELPPGVLDTMVAFRDEHGPNI